MYYDFKNCTLCPRACGADRTAGYGLCGCKREVRIAKVMEHFWEEPCLATGGRPSGAVFFSGCSLKCVYCQNFEISHECKGYDITVEKLAEIFKGLEKRGAANIDLVTPTHFTPQIDEAFRIAGKPGIPVVYDTSGYETEENVVKAKAFSDIYLCDLRYLNSRTAKKYSGAEDYPVYAKRSLETAASLFGKPIFAGEQMKSGVVVRVLVLPRRVIEAKMIISYLAERYGEDVIISVMGQYTPIRADLPDGLAERLSEAEYESVIDFAAGKKINAYMQETGSADAGFIPDWNDPGFEI